MENQRRAGEASDDNIIWRITCWISKAADTHSEYEVLINFHGKNIYANAHQYYVIGTLSLSLGYHFSVAVNEIESCCWSMWFVALLFCYLRTGSDPVSMLLCSSGNIKCWTKS